MVLICRTPLVPCDCEVTTATTTTEHHLLRRCQWLQRQQQLLHSLSCRFAACWPRRLLHRLGEALVIGACFLSIVRLPPLAMSAPVSSPSTSSGDPHGGVPSQIHQQVMKWVNPCGLHTSEELETEMDSVSQPTLTDQALLEQIIVQAKNALVDAEVFRSDYVRATFKLDFVQHNNVWKKYRYNWLPNFENIPKTLGDQVPMEHLSKLELNTVLKNTYEYLQKYAVGLEQVVWDLNQESGAFQNKFRDTEYKLRATLCEIQVAMIERGVMQREDITRDIMDNEYRAIREKSHRNLRDWLIFRDYMNGLEYVIQVFEYFKSILLS